MRKKTLSPAHRREFAKQAVEQRMCSKRAACSILHLARSTYSYRGRAPSGAEVQMRKRMHELSIAHPRYGYRRIAALLREESWRVAAPFTIQQATAAKKVKLRTPSQAAVTT